MSNAEEALALFEKAIGTPDGTGEWMTVDQDRINAFADVTEDHQFIHVDPEKAAQLSPYKVTIAHGFLTLSLLVPLCGSIPQPPERAKGIVMGVNYGFDKIRFIAPVKVNSRIRATSTPSAVELKDPNTLQVTRTVTVEIEGETKPALVAEWVTRLMYS
ncbi:MAG TPA: MaoC family dehydratase [Mycobacteriales bacterium]